MLAEALSLVRPDTTDWSPSFSRYTEGSSGASSAVRSRFEVKSRFELLVPFPEESFRSVVETWVGCVATFSSAFSRLSPSCRSNCRFTVSTSARSLLRSGVASELFLSIEVASARELRSEAAFSEERRFGGACCGGL